MPIKDSLYALCERFLGIRGKIASTATISTCRRKETTFKDGAQIDKYSKKMEAVQKDP